MSSANLVNPELMAMAYAGLAGSLERFAEKEGFVPAAGMDGSQPPAAAGGDPAAGGGPPPMDPAAGGGAPPAAPAPAAGGGGGGGGMDIQALAQAVASAIQMGNGGMGGGGMGQGGGMEPIKPKIDVNVTMLQILKILAKLADALGVPIPAQDMVATQGDLTQFGMQQQQGQDMPAQATGTAAAGGQQQSAIPPIGAAAPGMGAGAAGGAAMGGGMKTSSDNRKAYLKQGNGRGFDTSGLESMGSKAAAVARIRSRR